MANEIKEMDNGINEGIVVSWKADVGMYIICDRIHVIGSLVRVEWVTMSDNKGLCMLITSVNVCPLHGANVTE